ncbi:MAG: carbohydrate-binding protein [Planctomycetaceae bacterium]|nr:MAG: carbohydrate-binding protein [Planctomycetaceae bacterium]
MVRPVRWLGCRPRSRGAHRLWLIKPLGFIALIFGGAIGRAEEVDPSRFERTVLHTGLVQPMEVEVASDGRIFVIELGGKLKRIDAVSGQATVVGELEVTTVQENGLIGMALDPQFDENGWIYLQYSPPDFSGQYVSRFDFRDDRLDLSSERRLFSYEEQRRECCHHAGSLEFGPDGNLYIGTGDNTNPFNDSEGYAPIDERADREPWDAQRTAANTKNYNGKVLRIRPEPDGTYSIPDGNLFPKDGAIGHPEIYVMGCRNPWRIGVDQRTGYLYWGDVGPDAGADGPRGSRGYDEINQAREAGNFGWPYFVGNNAPYAMVDFKTGEIGPLQDPQRPVNRSVNNTGAKELPSAMPAMIYYPAGVSKEFPEVGTGGRTACAGPVYYHDPKRGSETRFPAAYDRTLFAFEWSRNWILAVHLDEDSRVARLERFLPEVPFIRPVDLHFDRGGSLFVLEYGETWGVNPDARLVRIDYVRGNRRPVAVAEVDNAVGREPLTVRLSGQGSTDKDGDPLEYRWTYVQAGKEADGRQPIGDSVDTEFRFDQPGVYTVELEVRDPSGASSISSLPVIVGNSRPEVRFLEPQDGDFFDPGQPIAYRLVVRDLEDGTSDADEAEEDDWHLIESLAPSRLFVEAIPVVGESAAGEESPGLALIRKSDCFQCHAANRRLVGPSFVEIADKYRDEPHRLPESVARVREGSTGVWGKIGMLPHQQHTAAEVTQMVEYVYSVTSAASNPTAHGFNNRLEIGEVPGRLRLEATYTDLGRDDIPKLVGVGAVTLRSRRVQAEAADEYRGTQPLNSDRAEGKRFMGGIEHGAFLRFDDIPLDGLRSVGVRVASAGAGGEIEVRRGAVEGPLLGSIRVEVNGAWEEFREERIGLRAASGRDTLYLVFVNPVNRGGLMNIDSLSFEGDPRTGP